MAKSLNDYNLPEWMKSELSDPKEPHLIDFRDEDGRFIFLSPGEDRVILSDEDFENLYDRASECTRFFTVSQEAKDQLTGKREDDFSSFFGSGSFGLRREINGGTSMRLISLSTEENDIGFLEEIYESFLDVEERYVKEFEANSLTFETAFKFVSGHPVFWHKNREVLKRQMEGKEVSLISLWIQEINPMERSYPVFEDGSHYWVVEGGETVREKFNEYDPEAFTHHYFDPELTGTGESYEEALVNFSKNLFRVHGRSH